MRELTKRDDCMKWEDVRQEENKSLKKHSKMKQNKARQETR